MAKAQARFQIAPARHATYHPAQISAVTPSSDCSHIEFALTRNERGRISVVFIALNHEEIARLHAASRAVLKG